MKRAKCQERGENETRMQQAIVAYKKKQKESATASVRAIAKEFNVSQSTLQTRLDGTLAHNQAHESLMHLTKVEETELAEWIATLTQRGYAPWYRTVRELAEIIRNQLVHGVNDQNIQLVNYDRIGRNWVARFLSRHPESARRKCIEAARVKDVAVER